MVFAVAGFVKFVPLLLLVNVCWHVGYSKVFVVPVWWNPRSCSVPPPCVLHLMLLSSYRQEKSSTSSSLIPLCDLFGFVVACTPVSPARRGLEICGREWTYTAISSLYSRPGNLALSWHASLRSFWWSSPISVSFSPFQCRIWCTLTFYRDISPPTTTSPFWIVVFLIPAHLFIEWGSWFRQTAIP